MTYRPPALEKLLYWGPKWAIFGKVYAVLAVIGILGLALQLGTEEVCQGVDIATGEPSCRTELDTGIFFAILTAGILLLGATAIPLFALAILAEALAARFPPDKTG